MAEETVLIAARDAAQGNLLGEVLRREGYRCRLASARADILQQVQSERPELLMLDADLDGTILEIVPELQVRDRDLGILVLLWETDRDAALRAAQLGILDFITKPLDRDKVPIRLTVAAERRRRLVAERVYRLALEQRINQRTEEVWEKKERLRRQLLSTVEALAQTLGAKHAYTEGHSRRVTQLAVALARAAALSPNDVREVELAARFHDIGKIGIRDQVLDKPAKLTDEEYEHIKTHPLIAERILGPIDEFRSFLPLVKHEHERYDGKGYPSGLRGENIPLGSRIIAIADAYDALVSDRAYRRGCATDSAVAEIQRCSGTQFDPRLVDLFVRVVRDGKWEQPESR